MFKVNLQVIANRNIGIHINNGVDGCDPHIHDFFEIAYFLTGSAFHFHDDIKQTVNAGDYVIIEPGSMHYYEKNSDERLTVISLIFVKKVFRYKDQINTFADLILNPIFNIKAENIIPDSTHKVYRDNDGYIRNILNIMIYEYESKGQCYVTAMKNLLTNIIIHMLPSVTKSGAASSNISDYIKDYVSIHYSSEHLLKEIAERTNYSPNYLCTAFKKDTGILFKEFLQRIRISVAANMLLNTSLSIEEISNSVGYKDAKYFSKVFKKIFNITPASYRRQNITSSNTEK